MRVIQQGHIHMILLKQLLLYSKTIGASNSETTATILLALRDKNGPRQNRALSKK